MSFPWGNTQTKVTAALKKVGYLVTLVKTDETTAKAYAAWDSNTKQNLVAGPSVITGDQRQLYIAGNIKKEPKPGDSIREGTSQWLIKEVEAYRPTTTVLAYRVVVE